MHMAPGLRKSLSLTTNKLSRTPSSSATDTVQNWRGYLHQMQPRTSARMFHLVHRGHAPKSFEFGTPSL